MGNSVAAKEQKRLCLAHLEMQKDLMNDEMKKGNKDAYQYHKDRVEKLEVMLVYLN